jgi:hypothetical protein
LHSSTNIRISYNRIRFDNESEKQSEDKKCLDLKNEIRHKFEAVEGTTTIFDHFGSYRNGFNKKDRIMMLATYKSGENDEWADLPFKDKTCYSIYFNRNNVAEQPERFKYGFYSFRG